MIKHGIRIVLLSHTYKYTEKAAVPFFNIPFKIMINNRNVPSDRGTSEIL